MFVKRLQQGLDEDVLMYMMIMMMPKGVEPIGGDSIAFSPPNSFDEKLMSLYLLVFDLRLRPCYSVMAPEKMVACS
jgi:hypothetical protein